MSISLKDRKIEASKSEFTQFVALFLYFSSENKAGQQVYTSMKCKVHLINGLKVNILVENNILSLERFVINIKKNRTFIKSCRVPTSMNVRQHGQFFKKKLLIRNANIILPCPEIIFLLVPIFLLNDRNFIFYLIIQANLTLYTYIIDHITTKILVINTSNCALCIYDTRS